jgi:hypothetical protein
MRFPGRSPAGVRGENSAKRFFRGVSMRDAQWRFRLPRDLDFWNFPEKAARGQNHTTNLVATPVPRTPPWVAAEDARCERGECGPGAAHARARCAGTRSGPMPSAFGGDRASK